MSCSLRVLSLIALVLNACSFVLSDGNVTTREQVVPSEVTQPSGTTHLVDIADVSKLTMEGGGTVTVQQPSTMPTPVAKQDAKPSKAPKLTEGGDVVLLPLPEIVTPSAVIAAGNSTDAQPSSDSGRVHTLNDIARHTDADTLLETVNEGGAQVKTSSIVARKGAPPEAPGVTESEGNADVQSLFSDEMKTNVSAISMCNSTLQVNTSGSDNCSQEKFRGKPPQVTEVTTTVIVDGGIAEKPPSVAPEKIPHNESISKPVLPNELAVNSTHNTIKAPSIKPNTTHNTSVKKKFKPLTTSDIDESKELLLTTDTPASKGDYIIPIIGIILAVPMVVILFMFFYKRSAEFWERRHYKRMDFLIDGMYNE